MHLKMILTFKEAAEYNNIGTNKINRMLRVLKYPFVLFGGNEEAGQVQGV